MLLSKSCATESHEDSTNRLRYLVNAGFVTGQDITVDGGASKVKK